MECASQPELSSWHGRLRVSQMLHALRGEGVEPSEAAIVACLKRNSFSERSIARALPVILRDYLPAASHADH